jgi:hypothetical protein
MGAGSQVYTSLSQATRSSLAEDHECESPTGRSKDDNRGRTLRFVLPRQESLPALQSPLQSPPSVVWAVNMRALARMGQQCGPPGWRGELPTPRLSECPFSYSTRENTTKETG